MLLGFLAGLDWGSFLGGIVGAAGAFLAVVVTDKRAERRNAPIRHSKKVSAIINAILIIEDGIYQLQFMPKDATFNEVLEAIIRGVTRPLQQMLPAAVEADQEMYRHVLDTLSAVKNGMRQWLENKEYMSEYDHRISPNSYPEATDMKVAVLRALTLRHVDLILMEQRVIKADF